MADLLRGVVRTGSLLAQDVLPTATVFLFLMALMVRYGKAPPPSESACRQTSNPPRFAELARRMGSTIAGGFLVFAALVVVFYSLGGQSLRYILKALGSGFILAFGVVGPVFLFAVWIQHRNSPAP